MTYVRRVVALVRSGHIEALLGALLLAVASGRPAAAQSSGAIGGRVLASDAGGATTPAVGAFILLDGVGRPVAQTDAEGWFHVGGLAAGVHTVDVRLAGRAAAIRAVEVPAGATATVELTVASSATKLAAVTVIGSRAEVDEIRGRMMRVPGSVALVGSADIGATRQANLNDVLKLTPGVYVQPRFGAADESQISVRGSGLRGNFHARGVNLLVNGMPYRNADGFTDFESLELLTAEAIEVYKGANALRYGGSTLGGAINLDTKSGYTAGPLSLYVQGGGNGFYKTQVASGGRRGDFDYYSSYAHTQLDGYRDWSDQRRDRVNLHAGYRLSASTDARAFYFYAHVQEHLPGSLTRDQLATDPRRADPTNVAGRWGRDYDLHHVGLQLRAQLTPTQRLEVSPYLQYRDIDHPIFEVLAQRSHDVGAELRYDNTAPIAGRENRLTVGVQPAYETMRNRQYRNVKGEHGALTRDERDRATTLAAYVENALSLSRSLTAVVGARVDRSTRRVDDDFLANGDQSDRRTYAPVTPRAGLLYALPSGGQIFANASRTVEPPLFLELSSFGNAGGFIDLAAQKAWQYEVGTRAQHRGLSWDASLYDVELRDEILNLNVQPFAGAPFTVPTYRNSPRTRHYGAELGAAYRLPGAVFSGGDRRDNLAARIAYTYSRFTYVEDPAYAGNGIPGAPRHYVVGELTYTHPIGLTVAPTLEWVPEGALVNSANTVRNDSWANLGLRAEWTMARRGLSAFLSAQNLADRRMSRSVQVDNAAGKFFEPSDRRSFYAGLRWGR